MTDPTNKDIAEALRSITDLPLGVSLILRLAADRLSDGWIEWKGGEYPPVRVGTPIYVRHRDTGEHPCTVGGEYASDWTHTDEPGDIIAYRIVK